MISDSGLLFWATLYIELLLVGKTDFTAADVNGY